MPNTSNPMPTKMYKYFRPETGKYEDVQEEFWQWEAIYNDLSSLKQFDDQGAFHQLREIDQKRLVRFIMFSPYADQLFDLHFDSAHMKLIHMYRRLRLAVGGPNEVWIKLYCFGFETNVNGVVIKAINVLMPDGRLILTNDPDTIVFANPDEIN